MPEDALQTDEKRDRLDVLAAAATPREAALVDDWYETMINGLRESDNGNNPFYSDDDDTVSLARELAQVVVTRLIRPGGELHAAFIKGAQAQSEAAVRERDELRAAALSLVGALPYEPGSMLGGKIALVRAALHREDGA